MRELMESKDILAEPRVVAAWHGLVTGLTGWKTKSNPIDVSIYEAAFRMRDACGDTAFVSHLMDVYGIPECRTDLITSPKPIHWIVAATLAWEKSNA
jgi:hypothetical protein